MPSIAVRWAPLYEPIYAVFELAISDPGRELSLCAPQTAPPALHRWLQPFPPRAPRAEEHPGTSNPPKRPLAPMCARAPPAADRERAEPSRPNSTSCLLNVHGRRCVIPKAEPSVRRSMAPTNQREFFFSPTARLAKPLKHGDPLSALPSSTPRCCMLASAGTIERCGAAKTSLLK